MVKKKHILTKKTAGKKRKLSQTPAAIAKRRERDRRAGLIPATKQRGRKPGSKNKSKGNTEVAPLILSILPPRVKLQKIEEITINLEKEELHILHTYPSLKPAEKLKMLDRLTAITKELSIMSLYNEMLLSEQLKKKPDA